MRRSKKILLLSQYFPPETNSAANRMAAMARKLAEHHEVYVITLKPSYPSTSFFSTLPLEDYDHALPYKIKRTFRFHPHKGGLLVRAVREQVMSIRLIGHAALSHADIVLVSSPSMFLGPAALILARSKRARFIWDVRDVTWNYAKEMKGSSRVMALGLRALEKYMVFALRRADLVVGATSGITRLLVAAGVPPEKAITVPNGISDDMLTIAGTSAGNAMRPTRPQVVYAGLIGYNQDIDVLIEVAKMLPDVDFVLVGEGPKLPLLKAKAHNLGTTNVSFRGYLNREDLLEVYTQSDILFAKVRSTPTLDATSVSSKLFEYMATGRPLVYAGRGVAVEFLSKIGCALTVPPEDCEAIAHAIQRLLQDPMLMRTLGNRGQQFVRRNYHRDRLMEDFTYEVKRHFGS